MDSEYVETVLDVVELVPAGQVTTYGDVARVVSRLIGRGGPRLVGSALREGGGAVAWWRVVRADGDPPAHKREEALAFLRAESCPVRPSGRVDLAAARADLDGLVAAADATRRKEMDATGGSGE